MDVDMDKILSLLERVTSGNAGAIDLKYYHHRKSFTITWKRPRGLIEHGSFTPRMEMLLYVKQLLEDVGVGVSIGLEITQEDFLPED